MKINELIAKLQNEIVKTQEGLEQADSLCRLKAIAKIYQGNDRVISSLELVDKIKAQGDEEKVMSGWKNLDLILKGFTFQQLIVISAPMKSGKCLAKGTEVLMLNGMIKKVEDIKIGDKVMGEDGKERNVLTLGNGKEEMFKILQRGAEYTVNKSHILSLKKTGNRNVSKYNGKLTSSRYSKDKIVNISVEDYLKKSNTFKYIHKGWKTRVSFREKELPIDPYFLGVWIGDGTSSCVDITSADFELEQYLKDYAKTLGLSLRKTKEKSKAYKYSITRQGKWGKKKSLQGKLRELGVLNNKYIPDIYKINSEKNRLQLLAGLIDTDGFLTKNKYPYYDYITKSKQLADDIYFLASSLGFQVVVAPCKKGIKSIGFVGHYFRISISGDLSKVPVKIARKKSKFKPQKNVLTSKIEIKSLGIGEYYGFELDGDGLFVLGNFVVTHNTSFLIDLTTRIKEYSPLWFPFEEGAEELIRKYIDRGEEPPLFYIPLTMKGNLIQWLETKIIESIAKYNSRIVFIDQLDFLVPFNGDNHSLRVAQTMRELKEIAKKWNVIIFLICHFVKTRAEQQPTVEDLRGSSSIGQEADTVILLWRETVKNSDGSVIITDNVNVSVQANRRTGKTGNVKMVYENGHFIEKEWTSEKQKMEDEYNRY